MNKLYIVILFVKNSFEVSQYFKYNEISPKADTVSARLFFIRPCIRVRFVKASSLESKSS